MQCFSLTGYIFIGCTLQCHIVYRWALAVSGTITPPKLCSSVVFVCSSNQSTELMPHASSCHSQLAGWAQIVASCTWLLSIKCSVFQIIRKNINGFILDNKLIGGSDICEKLNLLDVLLNMNYWLRSIECSSHLSDWASGGLEQLQFPGPA